MDNPEYDDNGELTFKYVNEKLDLKEKVGKQQILKNLNDSIGAGVMSYD